MLLDVFDRYVFLVLNTLQGLFILVFFTCSKKVTWNGMEQ